MTKRHYQVIEENIAVATLHKTTDKTKSTHKGQRQTTRLLYKRLKRREVVEKGYSVVSLDRLQEQIHNQEFKPSIISN